MAKIKRSIRFKEWGVFEDTIKRPKPEQVERSDGTLVAEDYLLRTDMNGFIRTGNDHPNAGSMKKIITLGDSFVESLYAHEQDRFQSRVERNLRASGKNFSVWNGGYSGSTLLHSFNVFMNKVVPLLPAVESVLIFTAMSDQRTQVNKRSYWLNDSTHAPVLDPRDKHASDDSPVSSQKQRELLIGFISMARTFGQEPIVVLTPFRAAKYDEDKFTSWMHEDPTKYANYLDRLNLINKTAEDVAHSMGVEVLDLHAEMSHDARNFYDTLHLNSRGQEVIADRLTTELQQRLPR